MTKTKQRTNSKLLSKQDQIIKLLKRKNGASLAELGKITDWQEHSIRGFMSGTLKKRLKLNVANNKDNKGIRRYFIEELIDSVSVKTTEQAG